MKITAVSPRFADGLPFGRPYPNAKDYHAVPAERLDDSGWLQEFVRATAEVVSARKQKRKPA